MLSVPRVTPLLLLSLLSVGCVLTSAATRASASPLRAGHTVAVVAHRGASAYAPENTLASLRLGIAMHADMVETDVQETEDHRLVVVHDATLARTTNAEQVFPHRSPWRVRDFTLAEIERLDAGSWKSATYAGEHVPTLDQVLDAVQDSGTGLMLEAKNPRLYPGMEKRLAAALARHPYWAGTSDPRRLVVVSFDRDFQRAFHAIAPQYRLGLIGDATASELPGLARWAYALNPSLADLDAAEVRRIHAAGLVTDTWTANSPTAMHRAIGLGVDGITTNYPDVLRRELRTTGRPSTHARSETYIAR